MNVGCDIVMISRVKDALAHTPGFPNFLSEHERAQFEALKGQRQAEWLAGRFAAKEAIVKALGCGIAFPLTEIAISHTAQGQPTAVLSGGAALRYPGHLLLTITHDAGVAAASALYLE